MKLLWWTFSLSTRRNTWCKNNNNFMTRAVGVGEKKIVENFMYIEMSGVEGRLTIQATKGEIWKQLLSKKKKLSDGSLTRQVIFNLFATRCESLTYCFCWVEKSFPSPAMMAHSDMTRNMNSKIDLSSTENRMPTRHHILQKFHLHIFPEAGADMMMIWIECSCNDNCVIHRYVCQFHLQYSNICARMIWKVRVHSNFENWTTKRRLRMFKNVFSIFFFAKYLT